MSERFKVSLVIPIYNEESHLHDFLKIIDALELDQCIKQLVFVDDASKDGSLKILNSFPFKSDCKIIAQPMNLGKGAALRRGFQQTEGDFVVVQDADFEYDPEDLKVLMGPLLNNKADVVFGSRFKKTGTQVHRTFHYLINRVLTMISNAFSGLYLTDMETCYKVFRGELIRNIDLESNRFGFEPEITAKIACLKVRVHEIGISYHPRTYLEGKKITWRDGVAALWHITYFNFFADKATFFRPALPERYKPRGKQWL